jgi:type II secretory pathway component GspD/PulD (secretin)
MSVSLISGRSFLESRWRRAGVVSAFVAVMASVAVQAEKRHDFGPKAIVDPGEVTGEMVLGASEESAAERLGRARITVRGSDLPLGNVLNQVARSARLVLVVDKEVRTEQKVVVDFEGMPLEGALAQLLTPLGYSYEVDGERSYLRVFVYSVATFKVSMPVVVQNWTTGISNGGSDPSMGAQGGSQPVLSTAGGGGGMGARVSLSTRSDTSGLWEEVERSLLRLLAEPQSAQGQGQAQQGEATRPALGSFSVNRVAGFVTVRALPSVMPTISSYFRALEDEMGRSVTVEVRVMQVDLVNDKAAGVDWNMAAAALGPVVIDTSSRLASAAQNPIFSGQSSGASAPVIQLSGRAGEAFIRALEQQGSVRVLAQPTMALGNNLPSLIELAELRSYVDQITTTVVGVGAAQTAVRTATVSNGLVMTMMPRVLDGGEVSLAVGLIIQEVLGIESFQFPGGAVQLPNTIRRSYSGVVRAKVNETLVMGGLITTRKEERSRGLPFLAKIPIIGILFGQKEYVDRKSELIITLTPREVARVKAEQVPLRLDPTAD